jgi:hypothetical protein
VKISFLLLLSVILFPVALNADSLDISQLNLGECFTAESFEADLKASGWKRLGEGLDSQTRHVVYLYHHNKWNRLIVVRAHFKDNEPKLCIIESLEKYKPAKTLGLF